MSPSSQARRRRSRPIAAIGLAAVLLGAGCGSDDDSSTAETMPISEWVEAFDQLCVETAERLSPDLTDEEWTAVSEAALDEMRALPTPSEDAGQAAALLEAIEATATNADLSAEEISQYDQKFLEAATDLGVSEACIGGPSD